jgi:hypothetical protein
MSDYYTTCIMVVRDPIETDHIIQINSEYINRIKSYENIDRYEFFSYEKNKFDKIKNGDILALCRIIGSVKFYYYKKVTEFVSFHTITEASDYISQIKNREWIPLLVESNIFDPMYIIIHFQRTNLIHDF